jgi:hypothetical protein
MTGAKPLRVDAQRNREALIAKAQLQATLPAPEALAAFLRGMVDHVHAHQGLARTLATLMATRSDALAEGGRALERRSPIW